MMDFYYNYPRLNYGFSDPFNFGCNNFFFEDFIEGINRRYLEQQRYQKELEERRNRVNAVREVEDSDEFQIEIFKKCGGFKGYEVKVVRSKTGEYVLKVFGNDDKFQRHYLLNEDVVDLSKIHWNLYNDGTTLVFRLPKLQEPECTEKLHSKPKKHIKMRKAEDSSHKNKRKHGENKVDQGNSGQGNSGQENSGQEKSNQEKNSQFSGNTDNELFKGFDDQQDFPSEVPSTGNEAASGYNESTTKDAIEKNQDLRDSRNGSISSETPLASSSESETEKTLPLHKTYSPTLEEVQDEEWSRVVA